MASWRMLSRLTKMELEPRVILLVFLSMMFLSQSTFSRVYISTFISCGSILTN